MEFLDEKFTYPYIDSVSGLSFRQLWAKKGWELGSVGDLILHTRKYYDLVFNALGYDYELFHQVSEKKSPNFLCFDQSLIKDNFFFHSGYGNYDV